jgi:hypothetical protein
MSIFLLFGFNGSKVNYQRKDVMKKLIPLCIGVLILAFIITVFAEEGKTQTTCPVMGGTVDHKLYVDSNGYRIYVCCGGCVKAVKADPEKYIEKMKAEGVEIEKTPVK